MMDSQALIAAWLPGTSGGQGIVNAIVGQYQFRPNGQTDWRNTLSVDWPRTMVIYFVIIFSNHWLIFLFIIRIIMFLELIIYSLL